MRSEKPIASLSLDVDNRWSYLKTHGDSGWESFPSYLDILVPRVLEFLEKRDLRITFFVVGQDAALIKNQAVIRSISEAGHEIGNHSFSHEPWLHLYSREKVQKEIEAAEEQIAEVVGHRPVGFRGPGFSLSEATLDILVQRGYLYDASTLPTFIGPLARIYYFLTSHLSKAELNQRSALFGSTRDGFRPLKPYRWRGEDGVLEIPVTTMPVFRCPIHMSYVLYLSTFSSALALRYFQTGLTLCRLTGVAPSVLLHPLDFLGHDDGVGLEFFPAMKMTSEQKLRIVSHALRVFGEEFRVTPLKEYALHLVAASKLNVVMSYVARSVPSMEK
jgi:hypothetical protein